MTRDDLKGICKRLSLYFERATPASRDTMELWHQDLQSLPAEYLSWAEEQVRDRYEAWPRNLPKVLKGLWREWLSVHPDRASTEGSARNCSNPWCDDGIMHVGKDIEGSWNVFAYGCAQCGQAPISYGRAYPAELAAHGFELDEIDRTLVRFQERFGKCKRNRKGEIDWRAVVKQMGARD